MASDYGYTRPPRSWDSVGTGIYRPSSLTPPKPIQPIPQPPASDYQSPAAPVSQGWAGKSGDPVMDAFLQHIMANYGASSRGARLGALASAGEDPSLGAYSGQQAGMAEQGQTARGINDFVAQLLSRREGYAQDEKMMRLRMEMEKQAQGNPLWGTIGQVGGMGLGALLGGL